MDDCPSAEESWTDGAGAAGRGADCDGVSIMNVGGMVYTSGTGAFPGVHLQHFNDEIVAKMELADEGKWLLMARVKIWNYDSDFQNATGKLVHDANVVLVEDHYYLDEKGSVCLYLQVGFISNGEETVTLECSTYAGRAEMASIVALKVDDIEFQG